MNTKIAIATTVMTAAIAMTSTAEAGVRIGFGFPIGAMVVHKHMEAQQYEARQRAYRAAKAEEAARLKRQQAIAAAKARQEKAKAIAAAKAEAAKADKADEIAAAKARVAARAQANAAGEQAKNETAATTTAANTSRSSVDSASAPVKTAENTRTAGGGKISNTTQTTKLECKRYFANVGLTVSVPCEN